MRGSASHCSTCIPATHPARGKIGAILAHAARWCLDHVGTVTQLHEVQARLAFLNEHYHRALHGLFGKRPSELWATAALHFVDEASSPSHSRPCAAPRARGRLAKGSDRVAREQPGPSAVAQVWCRIMVAVFELSAARSSHGGRTATAPAH